MGSPGRCVRFRIRIFSYFAGWVLVALAFQVFLQPLGLTETALTPIQQRMLWPLWAPVMVIVGLAQAATWPASPQAVVGISVAVGMVFHAFAALTISHFKAFIVLMLAQMGFLTIAVIYFVRWSQLPSGG